MKDVIGIDLSLKTAQIAILGSDGELTEETSIKATESSLRKFFSRHEPSLVVMETGGTTAWVQRLAASAGHEVVVANARKVRLITNSSLKTDRIDAKLLARIARFDRSLLYPVVTRSEDTQKGRALMVVRRTLIGQRTESVNVIRGILRGFGHVFPVGGAVRFTARVEKKELPEDLRVLVTPLIETIDQHTAHIEKVDAAIADLSDQHPIIEHLMTVPGVGRLIATNFVLCIEDPDRFQKSRDVACFLGLRPRLYDSGKTRRQGRITKEGDSEMRRLMVQAAHVLLRCNQDSELKRWGLKLKAKKGTKKAVVAVARKLAVLLQIMWKDGVVFEPFNTRPETQEAA